MQPRGTSPRRGEFYWLEEAARGSEQARRPDLIVSNDVGNRLSGIVIVASATSRIPPRAYPIHVRVQPTSKNGLLRESIAMCELPITVPKERLEGRICELAPENRGGVERALRVSLAPT